MKPVLRKLSENFGESKADLFFLRPADILTCHHRKSAGGTLTVCGGIAPAIVAPWCRTYWDITEHPLFQSFYKQKCQATIVVLCLLSRVNLLLFFGWGGISQGKTYLWVYDSIADKTSYFIRPLGLQEIVLGIFFFMKIFTSCSIINTNIVKDIYSILVGCTCLWPHVPLCEFIFLKMFLIWFWTQHCLFSHFHILYFACVNLKMWSVWYVMKSAGFFFFDISAAK